MDDIPLDAIKEIFLKFITESILPGFKDKIKIELEKQYKNKDSILNKNFTGLSLQKLKSKIFDSEGNLLFKFDADGMNVLKEVSLAVYKEFRKHSKLSTSESIIYHLVIIIFIFFKKPLWISAVIPTYIKLNRYCFADKKIQLLRESGDYEFSYKQCYDNYVEDPKVKNAYLMLG